MKAAPDDHTCEAMPLWLLPCACCARSALGSARVVRNVLRDADRREDLTLDYDDHG